MFNTSHRVRCKLVAGPWKAFLEAGASTAFAVRFLHLIRRSGARSDGGGWACLARTSLRHRPPLQEPFLTVTHRPGRWRADARNDLL